MIAKSKEPDTVLFLRGIPERLKTAFKELCVRQRTSMTQKIVEMIQSELSKEEKK